MRLKSTIKRRIAEVMATKGLKNVDLAKRLKVAPSHVSRLRSSGSMSIDTLGRLATAMDVEPMDLVR